MRLFPSILHCALLACLGGCFQDGANTKSEILPLDYQTSYSLKRGCIPDTAQSHGTGYTLVRANDIAVNAVGFPFPEGSVLVSERHQDPSCSSLAEIRVMAKQAAGYAPDMGDWRWQRVNSIQRVLEDGKLSACASCHNSQCLTSDSVCSMR